MKTILLQILKDKCLPFWFRRQQNGEISVWEISLKVLRPKQQISQIIITRTDWCNHKVVYATWIWST